MVDNGLIKYCRYYRGENKNPFSGITQNKAMFWDYERYWVIESKRGNTFSEELTNYLNNDLDNFNFNDGAPVTLKAVLFNRYAQTSYSLRDAVEPFKEFYKKEYLSK